MVSAREQPHAKPAPAAESPLSAAEPDWRRPSLLSWNITRQCNLTCLHCYRDARGKPDPNELITQEGVRLITEAASVGFRILILSGGEPLLRSDLGVLIQAARDAGLRPVLGTNGTLITSAEAERLRGAGLARAGISLDSAVATYHNRLRGSETAWQDAVAGMKACRSAGLPFQVNTTVTQQNEDQILRITDLACELGAEGHHVFFLVPTGRGRDIAEEMVEAKRCEKLLVALLKRQRDVGIEIKPTCAPQFVRIAERLGIATRFHAGCLAGRTYCVITPGGEVQPCPYLPLDVGNVHTDSFSNIWRESAVLQSLREAHLGGACGRCRWTRRCFGCRARAYWASGGDHLAEDPWCAHRRRTRGGNVQCQDERQSAATI